MPGVPTGRACDACRKQKKKCDEKQPACGRCVRLKVPCIGSGQQRYKFKQEHRFSPPAQNSNGQQIMIILDNKSRLNKKETPPLEIPPTFPNHHLTSLTNSFVGAIKRSTDLRYNLWWSFGLFLEEVPRRLGNNEALDRAVDAVTTVHGDFCTHQFVSVNALSKYSHALKTLSVYLNDPIQASASNTLCAVMILLVCQAFIGNQGQLLSGHAGGAANILRARKNFGPRDEFERKLFLSLRGSVLFEGLYNEKIDLSPLEWESLVQSDYDANLPEGRMMLCLTKAPTLIKRGKIALRTGQDLTQIKSEIEPLYSQCKEILSELKTRKTEFEASYPVTSSPTTMAKMLKAHYLRTYGLGLTISAFFNCMVQSLNLDDPTFAIESTSLVEETLVHAEESHVYRPVGAGYVILCLYAAWAATTDPQLRLSVELALLDYHGDFKNNRVTDLPRDLDWVSEHIWLGVPPVRKALVLN
ncbi:hypothetical protein N7508_001336 [Penicillium antarcticum]|uniref:uncharacterized protein n=1 Tax=Penicillium antarcticum TaxID=416450 RepID=UPI0023919916|nr:uncharacterized protein N7508_001336 [Penicillium antarcticum]KAJ5316828.1 hypothetical protein N7508_001336 [Penicillium antarcticum]